MMLCKILIDVSFLLKKLSNDLQNIVHFSEGPIVQSDKLFDRNGNQIGTWRVSKVKTKKTSKK